MPPGVERPGMGVGQVRGLPPGTHGIHVHMTGSCIAPDFTSAGAHFNPTEYQHGLQTPSGPYAGDLPNLEVGTDGSGVLTALARDLALGSGPMSIFDADGSTLVIHAGPDDHVTDPAGNSGARIACGPIARG
jgi:Cu-Zn family superoxide dismutase